jgi:acyl-CoA synthetase (AMP-forming)/AMP-acid ligase II
MSSATSTERPGERSAFRAGHFFVVAALAAATVAVMLSTRTTPAHLLMLSVTVFAAGVTAVAAYRVLAPLVRPDRAGGPQPLGRQTRAALEADKATVLRTIKELEFDRAMGKMSADDFTEMSKRLRHRAVRLMQQLDESRDRYRARIEQELDERLGARAAAAAVAVPEDGRLECPDCEAQNDADARFCKACGRRLES